MNWDYTHSLSIQTEQQRWNISCGLWRWKWFIFKDVAAYFHYFKVLLISMVLEMTNSCVQEEEAGIVIFFCTPVNEKLPQGSAAYVVVQNLEFYSWRAAPCQQSLISSGRTMVSNIQRFLCTHPKGPQPLLSTIHASAAHLPYHQHLLHWLHSQPRTSLSISPAPLLTPAGMKNNPCSLDKDNPLRLPPLGGQL